MKSIYSVFLACLLLGACSSKYLSNDKDEYLKSKNGPKLVVPSPLKKEDISQYYVLPAPQKSVVVDITPPH